MAKGNDRDHFSSYREQTRVKHGILAAYLNAYFSILGKGRDNLCYVDGFAGPGYYRDEETGENRPGSPIRTLELIASMPELAPKISTLFVEADAHLVGPLEENLRDFCARNPHVRKPAVRHGRFADVVDKVIGTIRHFNAPTFLFVDPCGVSGTNFATIKAVLDCPRSEAFVFFNVDGIKRVLGLEPRNDNLDEVIGSSDRAAALYEAWRAEQRSPWHREQIVFAHYRRAIIEDMGAKFVLPFRIEFEDKRSTSHYLIHISKHELAFKIMKEAMWSHGRSEHGAQGLELVQRGVFNCRPIFPMPGSPEQIIRDAVAAGSLSIDAVLDQWPLRPDDLAPRSAYRAAILQMEEDGDVEVFKNGEPWPASKRTRGVVVTLGKGLELRPSRKRQATAT